MLQPSELDDGQYGAAVFGGEGAYNADIDDAFLKNRAGSTAIEYALIGTLVSIAIISGVALMAGRVGEKFDAVAASVQSATKGQ